MSRIPERHEQRLKRDPSSLIQQAYGAPHIAADKSNFPHHLAANRAHVVMLVERSIVRREDGRAILRTLDDLETRGVDSVALRPELNDLFTCIEVQLVRELGDAVGGRLHTGRSRNDLFLALERMTNREAVNRVVEALLQLRQTLLVRALEQADTVFPGYTHHSQQAQPITFGHFLLSHHDSLTRDGERLDAAYARINRCPLGGAALAGTGFPLDRERVAELLGFDGLVENTADGCGARDFQLELGAALAIVGSNLGRLAESLILYTTSEFGYIELADEFASISSIMPQKKNPVSLEIIEAFGARATGRLVSMLTILKSCTLGNGREVGYCDGELAAIASDITWALKITEGVVATLRVFPDRALRGLAAGQSTATELADVLVRHHDLSFRQAHNVVGKAVASVVAAPAEQQITADMVNRIAAELFERPLEVTDAEVLAALDPRANVAVRTTRGGPAPSEVRRMAADRDEWLGAARAAHAQRTGALRDADQRLRVAASALCE
ncbi:MAG: argininosuccinate lyase [Opitutaceae bacterium]